MRRVPCENRERRLAACGAQYEEWRLERWASVVVGCVLTAEGDRERRLERGEREQRKPEEVVAVFAGLVVVEPASAAEARVVNEDVVGSELGRLVVPLVLVPVIHLVHRMEQPDLLRRGGGSIRRRRGERWRRRKANLLANPSQVRVLIIPAQERLNLSYSSRRKDRLH